MSPPVSVVMAVFNGRKFLPVQIASVLSQLESQDELVVIDDASSDGSGEWLASVNDARVHVYVNPINTGVIKSFERGFSMARHSILFLCDQDDVWLPGKRSRFVAEFELDPQVLVVVSDAELIDAQGVVTAPSYMETRGGFKGGLWSTLIRNRYLGCAMAIRGELLSVALPIPASVPMHDMWLGGLGASFGRISYIPVPLIQYRRHDSNVSPDKSQGWLLMLVWRIRLFTFWVCRIISQGFRLNNLRDSLINNHKK